MILTPWREYVDLDPGSLLPLVANPNVIDGRNVLNPSGGTTQAGTTTGWGAASAPGESGSVADRLTQRRVGRILLRGAPRPDIPFGLQVGEPLAAGALDPVEG
ncbi:hypothetical protein [Tessaracoccus coleopterorum]|uniref:hypothetical protein n=1 Tax=Tessaracoccus coleopterorum TaxID=2714950 RepID=UPI001E49BB4F|nr:hypothetical protein [Tessaracoccus coleopterorum]